MRTPELATNNPYGWFWEDNDEFMLPHANHIVVNDNDQNEICIIVVRLDALSDVSIANAEMEATRICRALYLADLARDLF